MQTTIKPLPKGQITIPARFRKALKIGADTLLSAELKDNGIYLKPLRIDWKEKYIRQYSDEEIEEFFKLDRLESKTLNKIKKYLA